MPLNFQGMCNIVIDNIENCGKTVLISSREVHIDTSGYSIKHSKQSELFFFMDGKLNNLILLSCRELRELAIQHSIEKLSQLQINL